MAVKTNITINIVEPGSDVPVPDTGLFTHGIGGVEASIIATIAIIALLVVAIFFIVRKKKRLHITKPSKHTSIILSILAIITSIGTFTGLALNSIYNNTNAKEGDLTVTAEDADLTIELDNEPVFAVLPVDVKVQESTPAGYTLTSYAENTDLVSTTDSSNIIPMITTDEGELVALKDNTYGLSLSLVKPTSKDEVVYTSLSTVADNPTFITDKDYKATEANDTTTIYYGFYITPDTPYGTYRSSDIYYNATTNSSKVIFNGNGLYFNNNPEQTTNDVEYITGITEKTAKYSHTPNVNDEGEASGIVGYHGGDILNKVITIPGASKISIKLSYGGGYISGGYPAGFVSFWQGTHPDYTTENNIGTVIKTCGTSDVTDGKFYGNRNNENDIITTECELEGNAVTFAYWTSGGGPSSGAIYGYYATVTGYDADGNIIYLPGNTQVGGEYQDPSQDLPYIFLGWNEDKEATAGIYESKNDIELNLPLIKGKITELYAIWQHATKIHFDGNGSTGGEMSDKLLAPGKGTGLCSNYTRDGYIFNNWNTKPDGSGESYGQCYWYTAPADQSVELNLYAQWSPATTITYDGNGGEGNQQQQAIRAGETSNIYGNWGFFNKDGYAFSHWNTEPDGTGTTYYEGQEFTASDQSTTITLYAQWAPATTIIYDGNGGEGNKGNQTIRAGEMQNIWGNWDDFFKEGYAWANWNTEPDGTGTTYYEGQEFTASDQSTVITLYAQWAPATTIIYDGNGYDWGYMSDHQTIYPGNTEELYGNGYYKEGYYFTGWNTEPDGSGTTYDNYQFITASYQSTTITLYAQWLPEGEGYYTTITFNGNGADGGEMQDQIVAADQTIGTSCNNYWKDGHWFFSWNTEPDGTGTRYDNCGRYTAPAGETTNVTLYAIWAEDGANTTIVYDGNGADGGYMDNQIIWAGNTDQLWGNNYWKDSYNFIGWNTEPDGSGTHYDNYAYYTASYQTETITLYAQWEEIPHTTIIYDGNGADGGEMQNQNIPVGQAGWLRCNEYIKNGYYFSHWNTESDGSGTNYWDCNYFEGPSQPEVITLYAQWAPATTIIYNANGGYNEMSRQDIPAGNTWDLNGNEYRRDDYLFNGWNTEPDGSGISYSNYQSITASDQPTVITLYAQWILKTDTYYTTINYDGNGADWGDMSYRQTEVVAGQTIRLYWNEYGKDGYYFATWNTESDGTGTSYTNGDWFTAPSDKSETITLYAQWVGPTTITFNGNGSDGGSGLEDRYLAPGEGTNFCNDDNYTRTGYYFLGWNTESDGSGTFYGNCAWYQAPSDKSETITLYAQWTDKAMLDTGITVNTKLKRLAGNGSAEYYTEDTNITTIVRASTLPADFVPTDANTISINGSITPVYAWYDADATTIYYYTESDEIIMNPDSSSMFYNFTSLSDATSIADWDTSKVTDMSEMFQSAGYNATTWSIGDLSSWDTSKVTSMYSMFINAGYNATTWSIGDLSSWDTSNVTNMSSMFSNAGHNATTWSIGDLSSWDTSKVTNMQAMFNYIGKNATTWSVGDLSSWDTSKVTNMSGMFQSAGFNATTWSIGDLSSWDTSKVTDMNGMFSGAGYNATTWSIGDLSSWNTSNVTNMRIMFGSAGSNSTTWSIGDLSSWDTSNVTNMSSMFSYAGYNATTWSIGDLSSWDTSKVTNMSSMFSYAGYNATTFSLNLSSWDTSNVTNMNWMFYHAGSNATTFSLDLSSWDTSNVTDMSYMFYYAGSNSTTFSLDLSSWDTSKVTSMSNMFSNAGHNATTWSIGDLSSWDTSKVTNMNGMFGSAGSNSTTWSIGDLSSWDTSNVTNMSSMFSSAGHNATTWSIGDLSSWDTSKVTNMSAMFQFAGRNSTTFSLDLSSWDTSKVTNMSSMFSSAGYNATTWSITIPLKTGDIDNTTSAFYGQDSSIYASPPNNRFFTLATQANSDTTNTTGSLNSVNNAGSPNQDNSSGNHSAYTMEDVEEIENTENDDSTSSDTTSTPSQQAPLGEYQSSNTTEGTNIIIPILIVISITLGTSALVLLIYKSRRREDE